MASTTVGRGRRQQGDRTAEANVFVYRLSAQILGWILRFWVRGFRAYHVERVPAGVGLFLICNHSTVMDPFLLAYPIRTLYPRGPGKTKYFTHALVGWYLLQLGIFPIRQGIPDKTAVRTMVEAYRAGKVVIIYPEGERTRTGELQPFFPDFARLALKLGAPVVPAALAGGRELMPVGGRFLRPSRVITVVYGEEMDLSGYRERKVDDQVAAEAAEAMRAAVAELLAEAEARRAALLAGGSGELG